MTIENTELILQCLWKMFYLWGWAPFVFVTLCIAYEAKYANLTQGDVDVLDC
jgi:hypothetical protein